MGTKERFVEYLKYKSIGQTAFEASAGLSRGAISQKSGFSASSIEKIALVCSDLSIEWLLTGKGEMIKESEDSLNRKIQLTKQQINSESINSRIQYIVDGIFKGNKSELCRKSGVPFSILSTILGERQSNPTLDTLQAIFNSVAEYNISLNWFYNGIGNIEATQESTSAELKISPERNAIPYYADLPVSAGQLDTFMQDAEPSGWVNLPGVSPKALFPVVGCSMKPEINPGDVVGIVQLDSWERVDPDKTYLIITQDDRMIKHLATDIEDDEVLWCISPNYPKFKINKNDIKFIYRISFCGKLM